MSGCCRGWNQGMDEPFIPCGHSKDGTAPCLPVPQNDQEPSLRVFFVCFNIFCVFSWLRRWGVVETCLFDHFPQFWWKTKTNNPHLFLRWTAFVPCVSLILHEQQKDSLSLPFLPPPASTVVFRMAKRECLMRKLISSAIIIIIAVIIMKLRGDKR